jgi:hypothetical protein
MLISPSYCHVQAAETLGRLSRAQHNNGFRQAIEFDPCGATRMLTPVSSIRRQLFLAPAQMAQVFTSIVVFSLIHTGKHIPRQIDAWCVLPNGYSCKQSRN